jgi:hypothetical protein
LTPRLRSNTTIQAIKASAEIVSAMSPNMCQLPSSYMKRSKRGSDEV